MKSIPIISFKKNRRIKFYAWASSSIVILSYIALFGGRFVSSGHGLLERYEAPAWIWICFIFNLIVAVRYLFVNKPIYWIFNYR